MFKTFIIYLGLKFEKKYCLLKGFSISTINPPLLGNCGKFNINVTRDHNGNLFCVLMKNEVVDIAFQPYR